MSKWTISIWRSLNTISNSHRQQMKFLAQNLDLTPLELEILLILHEENAHTLPEIEEICCRDKSSCCRAISSLAQKDLIEKKPLPYDLRLYRVSVTRKGYLLVDEAFNEIDSAYRRLFASYNQNAEAWTVSILKDFAEVITERLDDVKMEQLFRVQKLRSLMQKNKKK